MSAQDDGPKIALKFRVSTTGTNPGKWIEKWSIELAPHEEFFVTDELLKLPFRDNEPKIVCSFALPQMRLRFKLKDSDRHAFVNDERISEAFVQTGDRVLIADIVQIDILQGPSASAATNAAREESAGPAMGRSLSSPSALDEFGPDMDLDRLPPVEDDGPTLDQIPMPDAAPATNDEERTEEEIPGIDLEAEAPVAAPAPARANIPVRPAAFAQRAVAPIDEPVQLEAAPHAVFDPFNTNTPDERTRTLVSETVVVAESRTKVMNVAAMRAEATRTEGIALADEEAPRSSGGGEGIAPWMPVWEKVTPKHRRRIMVIIGAALGGLVAAGYVMQREEQKQAIELARQETERARAQAAARGLPPGDDAPKLTIEEMRALTERLRQ